MSYLLDRLHNDHKNFAKLLAYIELQLDCIKKCDVVDFETILIAMQYMRDYPDEIHHPLENVIFSYFIQHYDFSHKAIKELMHEHEGMPKLTEKIISMLEYVVSETPVNRDEFCEFLTEYLDVQKAHMNAEESKVYPYIYEAMQEDDWKQLQNEIQESNDPLFEQPRDENYRLLLKKINAAV